MRRPAPADGITAIVFGLSVIAALEISQARRRAIPLLFIKWEKAFAGRRARENSARKATGNFNRDEAYLKEFSFFRGRKIKDPGAKGPG